MFENLLYQHTTGSHWQPTTIHLRHPGLRTEGGELRQEKHVIAQRHQSHFVQNSIHLAVVETRRKWRNRIHSLTSYGCFSWVNWDQWVQKISWQVEIFGTTKHRSKTYKNIYALPCCGKIPNVRWVPTYNLALGVQHLLNPSVRGWTMQSISPAGSQTNCGSNNFWLYIQYIYIKLVESHSASTLQPENQSFLDNLPLQNGWLPITNCHTWMPKLGSSLISVEKKHWTHWFSVVCYICAYCVIILFISIPSHPLRYPTTSFFSRSQWPAPRSTASSRHPLAPPQQ